MSADIDVLSSLDDPVFVAQDVESGYGNLQVLYGIDLEISNNEIVLIFGPNGAGKSTFLKAAFRLLPLWAGSITVNGTDISETDPEEMVAKGISYVPQTNNIFPNLSIEENLDIGSVHCENPETRKEDIYDLFPRLEERLEQGASSLSGGERQMLAMGRALMPDPDILLIDEPSAGLAPQLVETTFEHVEKIRSNGTAVLMVEQNVIAALKIADRGYVLDRGETKYEGTADQLLENEDIRDLYLGK